MSIGFFYLFLWIFIHFDWQELSVMGKFSMEGRSSFKLKKLVDPVRKEKTRPCLR